MALSFLGQKRIPCLFFPGRGSGGGAWFSRTEEDTVPVFPRKRGRVALSFLGQKRIRRLVAFDNREDNAGFSLIEGEALGFSDRRGYRAWWENYWRQ